MVVLVAGLLASRRGPAEVRIVETPSSYSIVYEVTSGGDERGLSTEMIQVRRPFDSRVEVRSGRPPGDRRVSRRVTRFGALVVEAEGARTRIALPPAMSGSDVRFDHIIEDAEAAGLVERRGVRRVAQRNCQVFRMGGPVSAGELNPLGSVDGEHADVCIDREGLVLEEEWFKDSELLRRRRAVAVRSGQSFRDDHFALGSEVDLTAEAGNGELRPVLADHVEPGVTVRLEEAPAGFRHRGRYAVTHPRLGSPDAVKRPPVQAVVDVWVRRDDVLILEQGLGPGAPEHPNGRDVDLGALGSGQVIADFRGNEIRIARGEAFIRLSGTLRLETLLSLAEELAPA